MRGALLVALAYEERRGHHSVRRETVVAAVPQGSELFGVTDDGQRFLLGIPASPPQAPSVRVIIDGIAALRGGTPEHYSCGLSAPRSLSASDPNPPAGAGSWRSWYARNSSTSDVAPAARAEPS